jgi:PAS domain S-box-containing protein
MDAIQFPWELVRNMHLAAIMLDRNARVEYCNQYFLDLVGWNYEEVFHRDWFDMFIQRSDRGIRELFQDLLQDKRSAWHHENDIVTKSGALRCIQWNNTVVRDAHGFVTGVASIGEDISAHRALEREVLDAGARERNKLAVELHDGLGQELFGVALLSSSMAATARKAGLSIAEDLSRMHVIARNAVEVCGRMAHGLAPLSRVQGGLIEAFQQMVTMPKDWQGPELRYDAVTTSQIHLPSESVEHLYRIGQEAFRNAIRHSQAMTITIRLEIHRTSIKVEVEDDGVGAKNLDEATEGLGLKLMRYRSRLINAEFRVIGLRPHGTRVVCEAPQ